MTNAYDNALHELQLSDQTEPVAELIAKKVVEIARSGERDPVLICVKALKELGIRANGSASRRGVSAAPLNFSARWPLLFPHSASLAALRSAIAKQETRWERARPWHVGVLRRQV